MTATTGLPSITVDRAQLNRLFEAYDEHDVTKILIFFTDDVEWTQPMDGTVIGRDNAERLLNQMFRAMPDLRFPAADRHFFLSEDGHSAVATWQMTGTMTGVADPPGYQPTGRTATVRGACSYTFRDGLISRHVVMFDGLDLLQQLGLMPGLATLSTKVLTGVQNVSTRLSHIVHR
jgi:steroid delta-isomerase-like uncharacterized protein